MQIGDTRQVSPVRQAEQAVLLLGATPQPPCAQLLGHACRVERVRGSDELQAQICFALMLSPTVLVVGGFGGEPWPGMAELCEALAASAEVEESDVRFRWIKDQGVPLGAEFYAQGERVYAISGAPDQAQRMLRYLGSMMAKAGQAKAEPSQAPRTAPVPPSAPPAPQKQEYLTAEIKASEIEQRPEPENPWAFIPPPTLPPGRLKKAERVKPVREKSAKPKKGTSKNPVVGDAPPRVPPQKAFRMATAAVLAIATAVFVASGVYLAHYAADSSIQRKKTTELATLYHGNHGDAANNPDLASISYTSGGMLRKFSALYAQNADIRGWISIPAAGVDLPILQARDNEYYLTHDAEKALSRYGALFLDSNDKILPGQANRNLSIYGHHTKNGSMFGQLNKFRDQAFYDKNPTFTFDTLYEEKQWVIFAVIVTAAEPGKDGSFFEWRGDAQIAAPRQAEDFIAQLRERSLIQSTVDVAPGDRLLSLTTCCYDFKNARLVVFARETRRDETFTKEGNSAANPSAA